MASDYEQAEDRRRAEWFWRTLVAVALALTFISYWVGIAMTNNPAWWNGRVYASERHSASGDSVREVK